MFSPEHSALSRQHSACPNDLETLTILLFNDLPSYANRVIQRSKRRNLSLDLATYVIVAGRPDFQPLALKNNQYRPALPDASQQVFFTTLERQYTDNQALDVENYHWLFLTQTSNGWRLVMLFTQFGSPASNHPPSPPQDNSQGIIGQAINLWLRDCRAGAIK
jgi:hypothetical protein